MKTWLLLLFMLPVACSCTSAADTEAFMAAVHSRSDIYQALAEDRATQALVLAGKKSEANARLIALVTDEKKTAVDYFLLANMLYRADPTASDVYMRRAEAELPQNPYIAFERGMHEHRAGHCPEALKYYDRAHQSKVGADNASSWAYATHCHLVSGDYAQAAAAWKHADFANSHVQIESSLYALFSRSNPEREREQLLAKVASGSTDALCELLELDRNWETDAWNIGANADFLAHDRKIAFAAAADRPGDRLAIDLCLDANDLSDEAFAGKLADAGHWGRRNRLPESSALSYIVVRELLRRKIAQPGVVLEKFGEQLAQRLLAAPDDKRALDLLAYLYIATDQRAQLQAIDLAGWKQFHLQRFAESYMLGKSHDDAGFAADLELALGDFPNSAVLTGIMLAVSKGSKERPIHLMRFVAAQFVETANNRQTEYRLNDFMESLAKELGTLR